MAQVPADRDRDDLPRESKASNTEEERGDIIASVSRPTRSANATEPSAAPSRGRDRSCQEPAASGGTDAAKARAELGWYPSHPSLVDEFRHGSYRK
jgi:hypothetical protein